MKKTKGTKKGSESDPNMFLRRQIARVFRQRMFHGLSTLWIYDWGHRWLMCASNALQNVFDAFDVWAKGNISEYQLPPAPTH